MLKVLIPEKRGVAASAAAEFSALWKKVTGEKIPVTVMAVGDVAFVGYGGEPFTDYTHASRAVANGKTVFCSCCTNGYEGYYPTENAFTEGGYEANSARYQRGTAEKLIETSIQLVNSL